MPFKAGDKVVCVEGNVAGTVLQDKEYVVRKYVAEKYPAEGGCVYVINELGKEGCYYASRFKLALVLAVGATVERIGAGTMYTEKGKRYTIAKVVAQEGDAITKFTLVGITGIYSAKNFKVVEAVWVPKVDDEVFIVDKDDLIAGDMERYINDGNKYRITEIGPGGGWIHLDNGYSYRASSLKPANILGYKAPPPPKDPDDLREHLVQAQAKRGYASLCSFAFEGKDGKRDLQTSAPCHAALNRPNVGAEVLKLALNIPHDVKRYKKNQVAADMSAYEAYIDYIMNRSPWAVACITKDVKEAMEKGVLLNVECNRFVIAGTCVAFRAAQEYSHRPLIFKMLKDAGYSEHTAWVMCCAFRPHDKEGNYSFASWSGGHDVIDHWRSMSDVIKFFREGYHLSGKVTDQYYNGYVICDNEPYRTHHINYLIASAIAKKDENGDCIRNWLLKNVTKHIVGHGWDKTEVVSKESLLKAATKFDQLLKDKA